MKRVRIILPVNGLEPGWGAEVSDEVAAVWVATGKAIYGPEDLPLKKGNLENYSGCTPLTPDEIMGQSKSLAPPQQTNKQTLVK